MDEKIVIDWQEIYSEKPVEEMGWYYPDLDPDIENALNELKLSGGTFLDLGTGPGTQAAGLAKRGFDVTGADISFVAIKKASGLFPDPEFIQDDILNTKLKRKFDYIFDRGCFHVMSEEKRPLYVKSVNQIIIQNGILFLKCFSNKEKSGRGPYRFSKKMIKQVFGSDFIIEKIYDTVYQGTLPVLPRALFAVMRKK